MMFCFIFGYLYGLVFLIWRHQWADVWPTSEMKTRGEWHSIIYGIFIAMAGGAVLSVIVLKNNIIAMTGVGVATTFMPPMVNGGLCLALATHMQIEGARQQFKSYNYSSELFELKPAWSAEEYNYSWDYSPDLRMELSHIAGISVLYTLVNVFFLLFSSYLLLKVKEIAPIGRMLPSEHKFFNEDIKVC